MEVKGIEPVRFWLESSISLTNPLGLQVIPGNLQTSELDSQESNTLVLESWKAFFMDRRV